MSATQFVDPKDLEPINEKYRFRKSPAKRWMAYQACKRFGHRTFQTGFQPGDWVRCDGCESEFRLLNPWTRTQRERDTPDEPNEKRA